MKSVNLKRKMTMFLAGCVMASSVLFSGCSISNESVKKGLSMSNTPTSTWMWNATDVSSIPTVRHLRSLNIDTVYVNTGWSPEANEFYLKNNPLMYATFIKEAKDNKIKVEALLSNKDWALTNNYSDFESQVNDVLAFNKKYKYRFEALHLDIEPYLIDGWDNNIEKYLSSYVSNLKNIRTLIDNHNSKNNDDLKLVLDVPFWYSQDKYKINGINAVDALLGVADGLTVMDYTKNQNDFVNWGEDILAIAGNYNNKSVNIAVEFQPDFADVSLNNMNGDEVIDYMNKSVQTFKKYKSFQGFAMHDYDSFKEYVVENISK